MRHTLMVIVACFICVLVAASQGGAHTCDWLLFLAASKFSTIFLTGNMHVEELRIVKD